MIVVRPAAERGHADHGWLDTRHTFSFADYYDSRWMGFGPLRVINEDRVQAGAGFPTHGHRDMEILSYVLAGGLAHRDSSGGGGVIRPGEVQRMTAGTGVRHSEYNASDTEPVHFLQVWIEPAQHGLSPGYEQRAYPLAERRGQLRLIAAPDGKDGACTINQDARVYASVLEPGEEVAHALAPGRHAWVHVARGAVTLNEIAMTHGDGAGVSDEARLTVVGRGEGQEARPAERRVAHLAEILLFDLP